MIWCVKEMMQSYLLENEFHQIIKIRKPDILRAELYYMDGLVSTGNKFPYTILKRNFANRKIIFQFLLTYFFGLWIRAYVDTNENA